MKIIFGVTLVSCIGFMFFCLRWNAIFKEDYFINNTKFLFPTGEHISYKEVEGFYYIKAFKNSRGEVYENPSYAIKLNNGKIIDFRPINAPNKETIEFLKQKLGEMKKVDFIEDIR